MQKKFVLNAKQICFQCKTNLFSMQNEFVLNAKQILSSMQNKFVLNTKQILSSMQNKFCLQCKTKLTANQVSRAQEHVLSVHGSVVQTFTFSLCINLHS